MKQKVTDAQTTINNWNNKSGASKRLLVCAAVHYQSIKTVRENVPHYSFNKVITATTKHC